MRAHRHLAGLLPLAFAVACQTDEGAEPRPQAGGGSGGVSTTAGAAATTSTTAGSSSTSGGVGGSMSATVSGSATGGASLAGGAGSSHGGGSSGRNANGGDSSSGGSSAGGSAGEANGGSVPNGGSSGASNGGSAGIGGPLVPEHGALLGHFYGDASITATAAKLGRSPRVHLTYYGFDDDWYAAKPDLDAGRIPFVNWEPFDVSLDEILSGAKDSVLLARAAQAVALKGQFFVDFGAEMNGDWSPWGGAQNGKSAAKFIAAYRYVHDKLVGAGATNIVWAWCPNVTDEPREAWNEALDYYPGDQYVDWACVDGYNWGGVNDIPWQSFHDVFDDVYAKLATLGKPIIIGEMASAESGGNKAQWLGAIPSALQQDFPLVKALNWFDIDKETDWRISSSPATEAAYVKLAADPYFNP